MEANMAWRADRKGLIVTVCFLLALWVCVKAQTLDGDPQGSYRSAYGYVVCEPGVTLSPTSTAGVAYAVKNFVADAARAGKRLKIRASRHKFHTTTSLACPHQQFATLNGSEPHGSVMAVAILQDNMDKVLAVDPVKHTMTVGAGMRINQLLPEATKANMSVLPGTLPAYAGLTLGGILTTGAHGTGDMTVSSIADMISEITWVDGKGNVQKSKSGSPEFNAISGGLGLTGIVTEITLQLTPPSKTKLVTRYMSPDTDMFQDIEKMLKHAPHILVFWRPDFKMYTAFMLKPADESLPSVNAAMTLLPSYQDRGDMSQLFGSWQADIYDTRYAAVGAGELFTCPTVAYYSVAKTWANAEDGSPLLYAVSETNNLVASECDDNCAWNGPQYNGTAEDVHYAIEHDRLEDWIDDVKGIFQKDLWDEKRLDKSRCLGGGYIWLRFGHPRSEYLHMAYGMKRPVFTQSTWLRSRGATNEPMRFGWLTDLLEEMTLCKYDGRPHWGKNYIRTFTHPKCPLRPRYPAFDAALEVQKRYDPSGIFVPNLWKQVVDQEPYKYYPGCALNKDCYCQEDSHCSNGMECVPSNSFPEFKICKPNWRAFQDKVQDLSGWSNFWKRVAITGNPMLSAEKAAAYTLVTYGIQG